MRTLPNYTIILRHSIEDDEKRKALVKQRNDAHDKLWEVGDNHVQSRSKETAEEYRKALNAEDKAAKAIANHDWYVHNKEWKKGYNEEYYRNNKEYWKRRLEEIEENSHDDAIYEKYGTKTRNIGGSTDVYDETAADWDSAEINYERAKKEYDDFMKKSEAATTPVSSFQLPQRKSLIDKGVNIIHKVFTPVLGILAKLLS